MRSSKIKSTKQKLRLAARIQGFEMISDKAAFTKPGSMKK